VGRPASQGDCELRTDADPTPIQNVGHGRRMWGIGLARIVEIDEDAATIGRCVLNTGLMTGPADDTTQRSERGREPLAGHVLGSICIDSSRSAGNEGRGEACGATPSRRLR
jgi:hypothetical protein